MKDDKKKNAVAHKGVSIKLFVFLT